MSKRERMFTNKSHSDRGKLSAALGAISLVSVCLVIYLSYKHGGAMDPKLGAAVFFALLFSLAGEVLGILSRTEKDRFYLFPNIGILFNTIVILVTGFLLYLGVSGV